MPHRRRSDHLGRASVAGLRVKIYRSRDGRYSIERHVDQYLVFDHEISDHDEVWSWTTIDQLLEWLNRHALALADFDET